MRSFELFISDKWNLIGSASMGTALTSWLYIKDINAIVGMLTLFVSFVMVCFSAIKVFNAMRHEKKVKEIDLREKEMELRKHEIEYQEFLDSKNNNK